MNSRMRAVISLLSLACLLGNTTLAPSQTKNAPDSRSFANFESPQAHPLAISVDGSQLYALNTPARSLSIYSLENPDSPKLTREIPVGLEPVSLAEHTEDELWVVNHLSDSVSVVDLSVGAVVETIQVADSPGDIVFSGHPRLAFISSMTERKVVVIDPRTRELVSSIPIFGNDPRTLLASADGTTVWVATFRSGNRTTIVPHTIAPPPPAPTAAGLPPAPAQGIIVESDDPAWQDRLKVHLPDNDIVEIDVASQSVRRSYQGVGTILFNLAQHPTSGDLWVANTAARNRVRFETELKGHLIDSRVTRITTADEPAVTPTDLNPDIDYQQLPNEAALSIALSQPTDIIFDHSGRAAYVTAFGTDRIGVLDMNGKVTARIEIGDSAGAVATPRSKRGPRALLQHPDRNLLYVLNRLSNSISVVDSAGQQVLSEVSMFDPTADFIRQGRGYLFDAKLSGNGTASCASCHIDGDHDGLAWDLGDPGGELFSNGSTTLLHPMKGPLLTQTLRGLDGERIFHWRADRPGLEAFNGAFQTLLGGDLLNDDDLSALVEYMKTIRFAPNRNRNLDDTLPGTPAGASARDGEKIFLTRKDIGREGNTRFRCVDCHVNSNGSGGFGFSGLIGQPTKVAQLRGLSVRDGRRPTPDGRVSGFGYGADGSKDDLAAFLAISHRFAVLTEIEKRSLEQFLLAFPTETAPIVGFTRTVTAESAGNDQVNSDLQLLVTQAELGRCLLVVNGVLADRQVVFTYDSGRELFLPGGEDDKATTLSELLAALEQPNSVLSFMGIPAPREVPANQGSGQ